MSIEAHSVRPEKPFESARTAFEHLVSEVSSPVALSLSHSDLEGLLHDRGIEVMRQILQGHVDLRGAADVQGPVAKAGRHPRGPGAHTPTLGP